MKFLPGTSGYAYKDWRPAFYPEKMKEKEFLAFYAGKFPTVEINSTFYRMPTPPGLAAMAAQVPDGFTFAFKCPQTITHRKRLKDCDEAIAFMWQALSTLGDKLGPVLFGLPPNMKKDPDKLRAALAACPRERRVAVEFRHASWLDDEIYALLAELGVALCIADTDDLVTPVKATASWAYARLRRPDYDDAALLAWRDKLAALPVSDCCVFFKHDEAGQAAALGTRLQAIIG
jgi:uncharacterized protein YecE (DUF72 family)